MMKCSNLAILPALILMAVTATACSTTTVEAPKPAQVTVVAPAQWTAPMAAMNMGNIANVATSAGQFNSLLAYVTAAGLNDELGSAGPITVFAPTDAAFAKLPAGMMTRLLKPENVQALRQVLRYHLVAGRVPSSGLMGRTLTSPTIEGSSIAVNGVNGVMVNNARVLQADIEASNGLIHSIDTVLIPTNMIALR